MMGMLMRTHHPMTSPYIVQSQAFISPSSHTARTISQPRSRIRQQPTLAPIILRLATHIGSDQTPVITFHLHQTYSLYLISPTLVTNPFQQMITFLLTTHSSFVLPPVSLSSFIPHIYSYLSFPLSFLSPITCLSFVMTMRKSKYRTYPKPVPLYSSSIQPVFP